MSQRLWKGLSYGLCFAAAYSLYVGVMTLVFGKDYGRATGYSLWGLIAAYCASGIVGGAVAGLCWPMGRTLLGRMVLGFIVACPVAVIFGWPLYAPERRGEFLENSFMLAVIAGPVVGAALWTVDHEEGSKTKR